MSIKDLRNKLKPIPVSSLEEGDKALDKQLGRKRNDGTPDFHTIEEGTNLFRIYPPHEQLDRFGKPYSFTEPMSVAYVPAYIPKRDTEGKPVVDSNGKVELKLGVRPVFNSKVHGKLNEQGVPVCERDLIDEYIRLTNQRANELHPDDEAKRKDYAKYVYGIFNLDPNKRINGILYRTSWVMYADKIVGGNPTELKRLEIGKSVKESINKIANIESANEPLGTDPFTDLDDGRTIKIVYNKQLNIPQNERKPADYYTTVLDNATEEVELANKKIAKINKTYPITDDQLEKFSTVPSLAKLYREVFTRKDFDIQLEGLKLLDEQHNMGIFYTDEFLAIAEEIASHYPDEDDAPQESTKSEGEELKAEKKPAVVTEEVKEEPKQETPKTIVKEEVAQKPEPDPVVVKEEPKVVQTTTVATPTTSGTAPLSMKERLEALKKQKESQG